MPPVFINLVASEGASAGAPDIRTNLDQSTYTTISNWTPPSYGIVVAICESRQTVDVNIPYISGNGLTWERLHTKTADTDNERRITMFAAKCYGVSPSEGLTTFDFSGTQVYCDVSFFHISGAQEPSGSLTGTFVGFVDTAAATGDSVTYTLAAPVTSGSRPMAGHMHAANETMTAGGSFTKLDALIGTNTNRCLATIFRQDAWDNNPAFAWATSSFNFGIACEVREPYSDSVAYTATITDSVGITDALIFAVGYAKTIADNVGITDALSYAVDYVKSIADSVGITDAISNPVDYVISLADSVGITDALTKAVGYAKTIADSMGITDSMTTVGGSAVVVARHVGRAILGGARVLRKTLSGKRGKREDLDGSL